MSVSYIGTHLIYISLLYVVAVRYQDMLTAQFKGKIRFTVAKKADSLYKVVSAASICAKVCSRGNLPLYSVPTIPAPIRRSLVTGWWKSGWTTQATKTIAAVTSTL